MLLWSATTLDTTQAAFSLQTKPALATTTSSAKITSTIISTIAELPSRRTRRQRPSFRLRLCPTEYPTTQSQKTFPITTDIKNRVQAPELVSLLLFPAPPIQEMW